MKIAFAVRAAAISAIVAIGLAGCSTGGSSAGGSSAGGAGEEQTLRLAQSAAPGNFDIGSWSGGESLLATAVYDTIVTLDVDGKLSPGIAESWEYNDDRTVLTLHIRKGMQFSDDAPVDANAVKASLDALRKGASSSAAWASVASVDAPDESTVVVTLSKADAALLPNMAGTNGAVGAPTALGVESSKLTPVGSGPYTLNTTKTVVGSKYVLDRNPDNWNVDAYPFEHVEVSVLADPTAAQNALRSGQVDVLPAAGTAEQVAQYSKSEFNSGENKPTAVAVLWLADHKGEVVPALADPRVREAINLVFDRKTIASKLIGSGSQPTNQLVNPEDAAFSEELFDVTPYDVDKAKKLMAEAGYADGFPVTMPSTPISTQFESVITQSLANINITVTWESVPFQDFFAKVFGKSYGMYFMFNGLSSFDAIDVKSSLGGAFNPFQTSTPELDQLLAAGDVASEDDQDAAWGAVNEYLVKNFWDAPLNVTNGFWAAAKDVKYTPPTQYNVNLLAYAPAAE
jgi:peptide/nickel transport system substrate-binding protein